MSNRFYTQAVDTIKSIRSDLAAMASDIQFSFRDEVDPIHRELVELLLTSTESNPEAAKNVIESLQLIELDNFFQQACLEDKNTSIEEFDPTTAIIYPILLPNQVAVVFKLPTQDTAAPRWKHFIVRETTRKIFESTAENIQSDTNLI
jgi:CHAT domain-containing protein